nr:immunoglobulin light chain junction region [Macaca mulatta]MOY16173.1 immunoglobulin light chain junction region [Macaca mulatta]MOY17003.1 immunoglobulin light chain junction region [Macaca mulatta]MOY17059.1 immunoglobulin light chain junction region [Macaca mulatta]MOY17119.1 immunoglobulin light chain junction region [Macaca mulatta]
DYYCVAWDSSLNTRLL